MNKLKTIYHIADVHIRNVKRHKEYRLVFEKMFAEIRKRGTEDSIIYLAGDIAHAKLEMSPELVSEISWLFRECSNLCPTILITGNHDCNMNNLDRIDVLTPIVDALNLPNFTYLKDTQIWSYGGVGFGVFSIFDNKDNWPKADWMDTNWDFDKKIALFHGPVDNSMTDIGYVVSSRHFTTDIFDGYDLALLGDICCCGSDNDFETFKKFIYEILPLYKTIIMVPGNHEYYFNTSNSSEKITQLKTIEGIDQKIRKFFRETSSKKLL